MTKKLVIKGVKREEISRILREQLEELFDELLTKLISKKDIAALSNAIDKYRRVLRIYNELLKSMQEEVNDLKARLARLERQSRLN